MSALTLRLTAEEHQRLRLAAVYNWTTIQALVTKALDFIPDGRGGEPCRARLEGPFLTTDGSYVRCGQTAGHGGNHTVAIRWTDEAEI